MSQLGHPVGIACYSQGKLELGQLQGILCRKYSLIAVMAAALLQCVRDEDK